MLVVYIAETTPQGHWYQRSKQNPRDEAIALRAWVPMGNFCFGILKGVYTVSTLKTLLTSKESRLETLSRGFLSKLHRPIIRFHSQRKVFEAIYLKENRRILRNFN